MSTGTPPGSGRRPTGPLGSSNTGEPPRLANYPAEPQYDLATIVQLVGVRPMTLWAWEQQLHVPSPFRVGDGSGGTVRHYSERDLVAALWLRDQILAGAAPADAAQRLLSAQSPDDTPSAAGTDSGSGVGWSRYNTGPIARSTLSGPLTGSLARAPSDSSSGPLSRPPASQGWGPTTHPELPAQTSGGMSGPLRAPVPSGALHAAGRNTWGGQTSGTQWPQPGRVGSPSGPLRGSVSRPLGGGDTGSRWGAGPATSGRELRSLVPQLIRAFAAFDTFSANRLVDEALNARTVEAVCVGLLQPAVARVGELWARRELSSPEEHFALNFVRGRLYHIFVDTLERFDGPLAVVACGPREVNDLGALMLAVFWRRAGLRVAYLGQDLDGADLVHDVRVRRPQVVCLSIMASPRLRALSRIGKEIAQLDAPRPLFTYSGAIFTRNPELTRKVNGTYLGDDPATSTWQLLRLLGLGPGPAGNTAGASPHGSVGQAG